MFDETWIKVGSDEAWLWFESEPYGRFLGFSRTRSILTAKLFLQSLIDLYGRRQVYSDEAAWYPTACSSLGLELSLVSHSFGQLYACLAPQCSQ
jgi:transposase-like protein